MATSTENDAFVRKLAEAAWATLCLLYRAFPEPSLNVVRIPAPLAKDNTLRLKSAVDKAFLIGDTTTLQDDELQLRMALGDTTHVPGEVVQEIFRLLPAAITEPYFDALHYYEASVREFCFLGDSIAETLMNDPETPVTRNDRVRAETSVHNAFKAVEAIIGEPPRDDRRFVQKLRDHGIGPDLPAGWQWFGRGSAKEPLSLKIRRLHELRDKRAAHSKTATQAPLTYYEMMDAQGCAKIALRMALEFEMKGSS